MCERLPAPGEAYTSAYCRLCYLFHTDPRYNELWGGAGLAGTSPPPASCVHLGEPTGERQVCKPCGGNVEIKLLACAVHQSCTLAKKLAGVACCVGCPDRQAAPLASAFVAKPGDPPCGVVIGSYGYPALIELQIKVIRYTCGDVPILISDDLSPGDRPQRIRDIAARFDNVDVQVSAERIGHAGGDMAAFHRGLVWAQDKGLRVLCKFSHRFLVTTPRWLQDGARGMLASGRVFGGQSCTEGQFVFPLRTEAVLMDVPKWHQPQVLGYLTPRKIHQACEPIIHHAGTKLVRGGRAGPWPWPIITRNRFRQTPGVLWHVCTPMKEYQALAARLGVTLDPDFSVGGNHLRPDYIVG